MSKLRVIALAGALMAAGAQGASAEWFGTVTLPDHLQLLAEVADSQQIAPGKPFVAHVTRLNGKVDPSIYVPVEVMVVGDSLSVVAQDQQGNKLMLSLIRRPRKGKSSLRG